jgi:hypothetical protein
MSRDVLGVWQGVAMDFLKFHPGPLCPTLLCPAGGQPLKRSYSCFSSVAPAGQAACGHLLPPWTPRAVRLCVTSRDVTVTLPRSRFRGVKRRQVHLPSGPTGGSALTPSRRQSFSQPHLSKKAYDRYTPPLRSEMCPIADTIN